MAIYTYSTLATASSLTFDPSVDILQIDDASIPAASVGFSFTNANSGTCVLSVGTKQITLSTPVKSLTTVCITFADGSKLILGDDTVSIAGDASGNSHVGTANDDSFYGFEGNDTLNGGDGDDVFNIGYATNLVGNDSINGGNGFDSLLYLSNSAATISVNLSSSAAGALAAHTATSAQGTHSLTSIERVNGTSGNDTFIGGDPLHVNSLAERGNRISEVFRGNAGNDSITGGTGNGYFTVADYGNNSAAQAVTANLATGIVSDGRGGTDTLVNVDAIRGGEGNDNLTGGSLSRSSAGNFFEWFRGNGGNDVIDGNNAATGGSAISSDRVDYSSNSSTQAIVVDLQAGTASDGRGGTDTLIDIDDVVGGAGNDSMTGSTGNEYLEGSGGNDTLNGAGGTDSVGYSNSTAAVIINLSAASITVNSITVASNTASDGMGGTDTLSNFERYFGSDYDDYFRGSDDITKRESFRGMAGNDTINGGAGIDFASYANVALNFGGINATIANGGGTVSDGLGFTDTLIDIEAIAGTNSNDTLTGGAGDQWFNGNGGSDTINGGIGTGDWVTYITDPSGVTVNLATNSATDGQAGPGGLIGLGGTDTLTGIENVEGSTFSDTITGDAVANTFHAGLGNDILKGGAGNDTIEGGGDIDRADYDVAAGSATFSKTSAGWTIQSGASDIDTLTGVESAQFTNGSITLRQANSNFNFGSTTNDAGATSDILLQNGGTVVSWTIQNNAVATGTLIGAGVSGWSVKGTGDTNADGDADIILQNGGDVVAWNMQGGAITSGVLLGGGAVGWDVVGTADIDNDGDADVLLQNGGTIVAWTMQNGAAIGGTLIGTGVSGWTVVGTGDFYGDGSSDVLLENAGNLVVWDIDNGAVTNGVLLGGGLTGWSVKATGDLNGDGTTDVILQNGGTIVDWIVQNGAVTAGNSLGSGLTGWNVVASGDYNGDGTSDVLLQNGGDIVTWTMSNGIVSGGVLTSGGATGWLVVA